MVNIPIRQRTTNKKGDISLKVYCELIHSCHFLQTYSNFKLIVMGAAVVAPEIVGPAAAALVADGGASAISAASEH